jgi:hypothetical protein
MRTLPPLHRRSHSPRLSADSGALLRRRRDRSDPGGGARRAIATATTRSSARSSSSPNPGPRSGVQNPSVAYARRCAAGVSSRLSGALFSALADGDLALGAVGWHGKQQRIRSVEVPRPGRVPFLVVSRAQDAAVARRGVARLAVIGVERDTAVVKFVCFTPEYGVRSIRGLRVGPCCSNLLALVGPDTICLPRRFRRCNSNTVTAGLPGPGLRMKETADEH